MSRKQALKLGTELGQMSDGGATEPAPGAHRLEGYSFWPCKIADLHSILEL